MDVAQGTTIWMYRLQPCLIFVWLLLKIQIPGRERTGLSNVLTPLISNSRLGGVVPPTLKQKEELVNKGRGNGYQTYQKKKKKKQDPTALLCNFFFFHLLSWIFGSALFFLNINSIGGGGCGYVI